MRPKAKREVRWEDETSNRVDTGASTSNKPKIRVLNHKDYKTWKVRIGSIYACSSIKGFFEPVLVFQKYLFACDRNKQTSYTLNKIRH